MGADKKIYDIRLVVTKFWVKREIWGKKKKNKKFDKKIELGGAMLSIVSIRRVNSNVNLIKILIQNHFKIKIF